MALISQSEFNDWKSHPVTRAFFEAAQNRIEDSKEVLSTGAGSDPLYDRTLVGLIHAYREMQDFRIEDTVDGN